jgi:formate-dependent nitrite reductase membrane component NrfD
MPRREEVMVPRAEFRSYHGQRILKRPTWKVPDVPLYLFLGGTAGASATMAALAELTGEPELARAGRWVAAGGATASVVALVHDLGRPLRFLHMLRVLKPTSPLSVGSWILAPFSGVAAAAVAAEVTGLLPKLGRLAGLAAGVLGPAMCTYTAVLLADTAAPAWHEAHRELPYLFASSALTSAAGAALIAVPTPGNRVPVRMGLVGSAVELAVERRIEQRLGPLAEPYSTGRPGTLRTISAGLTVAGAALSLLGRRRRAAAVAAGAAYLAAGACLRFSVFFAGVASTDDPKYVLIQQGRGPGDDAGNAVAARDGDLVR